MNSFVIRSLINTKLNRLVTKQIQTNLNKKNLVKLTREVKQILKKQ